MYAEFNDWLRANEFDPETITASQKVKLQAQWRSENNPAPAPAQLPKAPEPPAAQVKVESGGFDEQMRIIEAENERIATIRQMTVRSCEANVGNPEKCKQFREMCDSAVQDKNTTVKDFQLGLLRADRFVGPLVMAGSRPQMSAKVIEAAVARRAGLPTLEKDYDAKILEAADANFRHGLGIQELLGLGARQHGWHGESVRSSLDSRAFMAAAFGLNGMGEPLVPMAGGAVPSTYSIPNIISNVANKFLKVGFMAIDSAWSRISSRRSVNDFKQTTSIALNGALQYRKLAPGGEIQHDTIGETTYTNQAETYAIMLGINRTDLINDDLGALSTAGTRLGRGAALKINDVFWTEFLNNSAFFTAGNNNVSTGGGSALGTADGAAINAAEVKFINQTDPNSKPIGIMPKIMLVPPTLANTARRWMASFGMTLGGTTGLGDNNVYQGRYTIETSSYMENASYTGNSTAAWYLLADPADMSTIEVVFLNGRAEPTVETAEMDFSLLGIAMRGWIDFGCNLQEFRAGVRSAGS